MTLSERAMLVDLSINQYSGRLCDKRITGEVHASHGSDPSTGKWQKMAVAKKRLEGIAKIAASARDILYQYTLPWSDKGPRILSPKGLFPLTEALREKESEFWAAVNELLDGWEEVKLEARSLHNGSYNEADYPSIQKLRRKYKWSVTIDPLGDPNDFRVKMDEESTRAVIAQYQNRIQETSNRCVREVWDRLHDVCSKMVDRLSDPDAIFRDSLVGNVREVVDLLPILNVMDDPTLEQARLEVAKKLIVNPQDLRDDKVFRQQTADEAKKLVEQMTSFLSPN